MESCTATESRWAAPQTSSMSAPPTSSRRTQSDADNLLLRHSAAAHSAVCSARFSIYLSIYHAVERRRQPATNVSIRRESVLMY
jgi:hypothetical protein